jgi:nicotinate-nucleotide pyrophosphorylase (carboxylating)
LPPESELKRIIQSALREDLGQGDITSELLIPAETKAQLHFVSRETLTVCGLFVAGFVFDALAANQITITLRAQEGAKVTAGERLLTASGPARLLLSGERVVLNLMQRMCGVATLTSRYVQAVSGTNATILDTRKTMPGLRSLDKYAVRIGGGQNHRMRLDDMVLIKDNHIALAGSVTQAIASARSQLAGRLSSALPIVVECDSLDQVKEALAEKPDRILLDNMPTDMLRSAVALVKGKVALEASGGVTLETVADIAATGVNYISVGAITHSALACDIGADIGIISQS